MKNVLVLLLLSILGRNECQADVKFVDFNKIDPTGQFRAQEQFLLEHLAYYDHWAPKWVYDVAKDSLVAELKTCLQVYEPLKTDEFERCLLLGEVAHYLYNLDQQAYYDTAEAFYLKAIKVNDKECRGYWFLGFAYATSAEIKKALPAFRQALKLVNDQTGVDFWQEYAFTMELAGMPFHCRYGLDQYKLRGGNSRLSKMMDSTVHSKCVPADADISYRANVLWQAQKRGARVQFLSYPLGIRLEIDSNWHLEVKGYAKRITGWGIQPPVLTSRNGKQIGYSIALVIKVPDSGEQLEDFMHLMMKKTPGVPDSVFPFAKEYPNGISYSFNDSSLYADRGGARMRFIGIERPVPANPGLALEEDEDPIKINGELGKLNIFTPGLVRSRLPARIFYLFLLDTCEDIREESWKGFQQLITRQLVLD